MAGSNPSVPRLLRAARGEVLDRPPVWMMRQAGRYMKVYRDLREQYPSFRERSENPDLAVEISLQPFRAFAPDGVILFSDILTPLPGMGIPFDIHEGRGPLIDPPIRSLEQVQQLRSLDPESALPFIRQILQTLRQEVGDRAAVLGFVGAPWTLAAYAIEGKSSKDYALIKGMAFSEPAILHQLLSHLADAIADYVRYQIDSGAQAVQIFDSWAGQLSPQDFEALALPYIQHIVQQVKATHPETPLILYISGSAGILKLMARSGVDIISLDWTVDMAEARALLGPDIGVQGNMDPGILFGSKTLIRDRALEIIRKAGNRGHIMNLGHGILPKTPEDHAAVFFETVQQADQLLTATA
ncbi:uroporphyrinogen decarboxylase [Synechococcales cyanobacterium C]|uniref:Uroporphyrinogen decarboxylase n=1 Tax=Petrachloros mirabilis ULC683 TaxID=2781853 RepID=A0A8K1ZXA7_9CYAN|nr:uroporphyrinogen decarboxylase [Petrachloros mirabilis]NCJ06884.1 uroporphyrinogen decarboxylase [Petrachloros mirabilis ULC683]